ncbi:acyltransferase [Gordoniibacillus kamchatkensis]|uniref:acyltransferase n=1 Tax=Gordoniibacillus kamchatkensis TaxID=1590651 RepID=UPI000697B4D0|nr:acyltransferase [Paenibacillus sp. VKM B-2647]
MSKPKLLELDVVRGVAILAVVLVHGTAEGSAAGSAGPDGVQAAGLLINKLCAFAVPAFIFVSGLVLFYGAPAGWNRESLRRYYGRRMKTALVPYLAWSAIFYVANQWLAHGAEMKPDPVYFGKVLLTGGASYHLYFLVIIMQFYAVFPLAAAAVRRYDPGGKLLLAAGLTLQLAFYAFGRYVQPVPFSYLWAFDYASLFAFGGWFGLRYGARAASAERRAGWWAAAACCFGLGYAGLHIGAAYGAAPGSGWYELAYAGFGLAAAAALVAWARRLQGRLRPLAALGRASFGVYLVHPLLLSLWRAIVPVEPRGAGYALINAIGIAAVLAASYALTLGYTRMRAAEPAMRQTRDIGR